MGGLPDLLMSPLIRVPFNLHTLFFLSLFSFRVRIISELPNQSLACDSLSDSSRDPIMWFIMWFIMWLISFPYRWLTKPWGHVTTRSPSHTDDLPSHEITWQPDLLSTHVTYHAMRSRDSQISFPYRWLPSKHGITSIYHSRNLISKWRWERANERQFYIFY